MGCLLDYWRHKPKFLEKILKLDWAKDAKPRIKAIHSRSGVTREVSTVLFCLVSHFLLGRIC